MVKRLRRVRRNNTDAFVNNKGYIPTSSLVFFFFWRLQLNQIKPDLRSLLMWYWRSDWSIHFKKRFKHTGLLSQRKTTTVQGTDFLSLFVVFIVKQKPRSDKSCNTVLLCSNCCSYCYSSQIRHAWAANRLAANIVPCECHFCLPIHSAAATASAHATTGKNVFL